MKIQGLPGVGNVAEKQRQSNLPPAQDQPVYPAHQGWVMQKQFVGQRSQFGPLCQGPGQVLVGEGETFNGNEVQRRRMGRSVSLPGLPGGEKVQAGSKAVFGNNEIAAFGNLCETFGQLVVLQENVACFLETIVAAEIDIAEPDGLRDAVVPSQFSGLYSGRQGSTVHGVSLRGRPR